jgi:predicted transcriptional regulator
MRTLRRAQEIFGEDKLATLLGISRFKLKRFIEGSSPTPGEVFFKAVDVLEAYSEAASAIARDKTKPDK